MPLDRLTRRDVFTKSLRIAFKNAPCGCGSCAPTSKQADPAAVKEGLATFRRTEALADALKERHGALAVDCARTAVRWISGGRRQDTPTVRFFDLAEYDFKKSGFFDPATPDCVYVARGLAVGELCATIFHEASHMVDGYASSEGTARVDEKYLTPRYIQSRGL